MHYPLRTLLFLLPWPAAAAFAEAPVARMTAHGNVRYEFRVALAAGSEFTAAHGGTREGALAAMTHMLDRANEVLENDLGVHLTLAAGSEKLIVTDPDGDPLEHGEPRTAAAVFIKSRLPAASYDLGHALVGLDGGESDTGTVCSNALDADYLATHKAAAWSGGADADGAFANFLLVLGNQLGAPFRDNRCGQCLAFDGKSIERVRAWLASRGGRCAKKRLVTGMAPWIDPDSLAEPQLIPARTPFWLDARVEPGTPGRRLSFAWDDISFEPLVRAEAPQPTSRREVVNSLPQGARDLDFRLTVRDNGGRQATRASADTRLRAIDTGRPFAIEPIDAATAGAPLGVRWDPAGTTLAPLSCHFLRATLSIDEGMSWQTLAEDVPNSGAAVLTVPGDALSDGARLRLACDWRPFFAEVPRPFAIR
jgi:hypothetical protein